jgi:NLR family CARD domain-containing protein 3
LNLESNRFGDKGCKILTESVAQSKILTVLNLSKNNLTSLSADSITYFIRKSTTIQEIYLHYNSIDDRGGMVIFRGLYRSPSIRVVDMSFNNMGAKKALKNNKIMKFNTIGESAAAIARVISKPHTELLHLDISNNGYNEIDTKEFAKSLTQNTYLFGFHYEGNQ